MKFFDLIDSFNFCSVLIRVILSAVLGGIIGFERSRHGRAAGLRTHILVCVGSALTSLTGIFGFEKFTVGDPFRISAQVISGIGFLGVGMILVRNRTVVTGLTTAAGLWATATIGIALGYGFYEGAVVATLLCSIAVSLLGHFEEKGKAVSNIYLEISDTRRTGEIVRELRVIFGSTMTVNVVSPKSNDAGHIGILILVRIFSIPHETITQIENINGVEFVVEECNA